MELYVEFFSGVASILIDILLSYYMAKHFQSTLVGMVTYFMLAGITSIRADLKNLKRKLK